MTTLTASSELIEHLSRVTRHEVSSESADEFLTLAGNFHGGSKEALDSLSSGFSSTLKSVLEDFANRVMRGGINSYAWLPLAQIKASGGGFVIPELDASYRRWMARRYRAFVENGEIGVPNLSEEAYVEAVTHGRPRAILEALLGPNYSGAAAGVKLVRYNDAVRWPSIFGRRVGEAFNRIPRLAKKAASTFKNDITTVLKDDAALKSLMEDVLMDRFGSSAGSDEYVEFVKNFVRRYADGGDYTVWTTLPDLSDITSDDIGKILGRQQIDPEEFLHRILDGKELIDDSFKMLGSEGVQDFWDIPGIHGFLEKAVQRAGYEKGHLFELELLFSLYDEAKALGYTILMQVPIGVKDGPDIIRLVNGVAEIFQAKSYKNYKDLIGLNGEVLRQTGGDFRRLWAHHSAEWVANGKPMIKLPDGTFAPVSNVVTFKADFLRLEAAAIQAEQIADGLIDESVDMFAVVSAKIDDSISEMNGYLKNTNPLADNPDAATAIIGSGTSEAAALQKVMNDGGAAMTVQELFYHKLAYDPKTGLINAEMVEQLKRMNPPIEIRCELSQPEVWVF